MPAIYLQQFEVWFVTGSQDLYGDETLREVDRHSQQVAAALDAALRTEGFAQDTLAVDLATVTAKGGLAALDVRPAVYLVVHTNHAQELTPAALAARTKLSAKSASLS